MDTLGGYAGWRWYVSSPLTQKSEMLILITRIFIIEGLATIAFSFIAKFAIPDWPETARFLTVEEKVLLAKRLENDGGSGAARMDRLDKQALMFILKDWKIWVG
jgi:hypothetical protein